MIKTVQRAIKPETLKKWLDANEVYLLDVREPSEYKIESIKQSHLLPLSQFSGKTIQNDGKKVVIHCRSGMRSNTACERLESFHPELEIYNLEGGILAWANCGFPTQKGALPESKTSKNSLSIERQTQLISGILIIFGIIFDLPIITFLVGTGLIFASLSNWCGMAKLLNKMPWNQSK